MSNFPTLLLLFIFLLGLILIVLPVAWLLDPTLALIIAVTAGASLVAGVALVFLTQASRT
jgi:hypothetical protein